MKSQIYKNIDLFIINVKAGVKEYFLPKNVDWANRMVEKIVLYTGSGVEVSPMDGQTHVFTMQQVANLFIDLYTKEDVEIVHNLNAQSILHTNNFPLELNHKISLELSRIAFSEEPEQNGCLLFYVYWGTDVVEDYETPKQNVTVQFQMKAGEMLNLSKVVDSYIHAQGKKLRGISVWKGSGYITLRDYNFKPIVKSLHTSMCRPLMGVSASATTPSEKAMSVQANPLYLDCANVDFDNSFIRQATSSDDNFTITFLY